MSDDPTQKSRAEQIGQRLNKLRELKRLRVGEVATVLGITSNRYKAYESGGQNPSLPELEVLANLLSAPISMLISHDEQPDPTPKMDVVQAQKFMQLRQRIIATRLKKALDDADIPRKEIASALGITPKELAAYLAGRKPIPLAILEILCRVAAIAMQTLFGTHGLVGQQLSQSERVAGFKQLPTELQDFIAQPINRPYVDLANRLSNLPVDKLRSIAEGLLDITF
jgi:transcriptional regulator with XRE-family HTH domain